MVSGINDTSSGRRVLIVDRYDESREVLKTVLERRGVEIYEADGKSGGLDLALKCQPDLIIVDVESLAADGRGKQLIDGHADRDGTPLVLLGSVRQTTPLRHRAEMVPKPYHYGPLIRRIEEILEERL